MGPDIHCPSCGNKAGWTHSEVHPESCYACKNCGEHYSRMRNSVYVPVGMTTEKANELLSKGAASQVADDVVDALAQALGEQMKPYLLGKVINPEYKKELAEKEARCRWCNPDPDTIVDDLGLCGPHTINLLDENKRHIRTENDALGMLWDFIDVVSASPRQGNVFERGLEYIPRAREQRDGWEWLIRIKELMVGSGSAVDGEALRRQVGKLLQRVSSQAREIELLRQYGNKDCTAMADEAIQRERPPQEKTDE